MTNENGQYEETEVSLDSKLHIFVALFVLQRSSDQIIQM